MCWWSERSRVAPGWWRDLETGVGGCHPSSEPESCESAGVARVAFVVSWAAMTVDEDELPPAQIFGEMLVSFEVPWKAETAAPIVA